MKGSAKDSTHGIIYGSTGGCTDGSAHGSAAAGVASTLPSALPFACRAQRLSWRCFVAVGWLVLVSGLTGSVANEDRAAAAALWGALWLRVCLIGVRWPAMASRGFLGPSEASQRGLGRSGAVAVV